SFLVGALAFGLSLFPVKSFPASNPANDYAVIYNVDINKRNTDLGDINLSFDVETFDDDNLFSLKILANDEVIYDSITRGVYKPKGDGATYEFFRTLDLDVFDSNLKPLNLEIIVSDDKDPNKITKYATTVTIPEPIIGVKDEDLVGEFTKITDLVFDQLADYVGFPPYQNIYFAETEDSYYVLEIKGRYDLHLKGYFVYDLYKIPKDAKDESEVLKLEWGIDFKGLEAAKKDELLIYYKEGLADLSYILDSDLYDLLREWSNDKFYIRKEGDNFYVPSPNKILNEFEHNDKIKLLFSRNCFGISDLPGIFGKDKIYLDNSGNITDIPKEVYFFEGEKSSEDFVYVGKDTGNLIALKFRQSGGGERTDGYIYSSSFWGIFLGNSAYLKFPKEHDELQVYTNLYFDKDLIDFLNGKDEGIVVVDTYYSFVRDPEFYFYPNLNLLNTEYLEELYKGVYKEAHSEIKQFVDGFKEKYGKK
ncbi:MAG: hypothetical protein PWR32_474, partial [Candidatus Woesearchaeota archaeon]|nr:hypothetical protein [Candidatus Woesearchaeota archaeon]